MSDKVSLQLEFLTSQNKKVRFNLPNPKQPVDNAAIEQAMDLIVEKGIFELPQGDIVKKSTANLVVSQSTTVG